MTSEPIICFVQSHFPNYETSPSTAMVSQPQIIKQAKEFNGLQKAIIIANEQSTFDMTPLPRGKFIPFSVIIPNHF